MLLWGCRRARSRPCYDPGGLWWLPSQLTSWDMARLDSMSSLGSLGTNLRAAHLFGAGDIHFTALTVSFREFVQVEKWWHPVLWQMLLVLKGVSFYVHKIKMASESFPRPCSEKYFASLIFSHNKNQSQNQIKITAVGWIWFWMLSSEPVVQEDLELRFLTWLMAEWSCLGPQLQFWPAQGWVWADLQEKLRLNLYCWLNEAQCSLCSQHSTMIGHSHLNPTELNTVNLNWNTD